MNQRMLRTLGLTIAGVTAGEVLVLDWGWLAFRGEWLSVEWVLAALAGFGALNVAIFPQVRRRIRATGLALVLSRGWILGSVAALITGTVLAVVLLVIGGGSHLLDAADGGRLAIVWLGGAVVVSGFGSVMWGASVGNHRVRVDRVRLPIGNWSSELSTLRIIHITDLHIGPLMLSDRLRRFVDRINGLEPDLIVITGDLFDFDPSYIEAGCVELGRLRATLGVFAVMGNHDVYTGVDAIVRELEELTDIRLLRNAWVELDIGGTPMVIAGLDDGGEGWTERESEHEDLERIAGELPTGVACLLLAHRPSYFAQAARLGFSLLLVGHTHGGQVALPLAHQHNPSRMISGHTRGVFQMGDTTMYVNRGLGMAGLPLRINCPREIAIIELREGSR